MKEWKSKYNSFNSDKGLLYSNWYQAIRDWKDGKIDAPLAPVEVSLDPICACQLKCSHCNASRYLEDPPDDKMIRLPNEDMLELIHFLGMWGVKAICFGGGGEPTLHNGLWDALHVSNTLGMQNSIATNGVNFDKSNIDIAVSTCRWIGVSVDSATPETYKIGRGVDRFKETTDNIRLLAQRAKELGTNCDVSYKFLLFEYNQHEVYEACKLAKELGAKDFHCRPADLSHDNMHDKYRGKATPYDVDLIKEQFEKCHELEDENFHVYTIVHKFNEDFTPKKNFDQCYASPCCIQLCADGNAYLCPDHRYQEFYKLGSFHPNPWNIYQFWGAKKHYDLVFNTGKDNCESRCTFSPYCEQCQKLFIEDKDPMCWRFI